MLGIVGVDGDYLDLFTEFHNELAAGSTRSGERVGCNGYCLKFLVAFRDRFANGGSFGADAKTIGSILYIAAGVNRAVNC